MKRSWFILVMFMVSIIILVITLYDIEILFTYMIYIGIAGFLIGLLTLIVTFVIGRIIWSAGIILFLSTIFFLIGFLYSDDSFFKFGVEDTSLPLISTTLPVGQNPLSSKNISEIIGTFNVDFEKGISISNIDMATFGKRWNEFYNTHPEFMIKDWNINYYDTYISFRAIQLDTVILGFVEYDTNKLTFVSLTWSSQSSDLGLHMPYYYHLLYATHDNFISIHDAIEYDLANLRLFSEVSNNYNLEEASKTIGNKLYYFSLDDRGGSFSVTSVSHDLQ